jgi:hypothetical protein
MGIASSQKSFISKKAAVLVVTLIATGIVMRFFSPPQKLDARFFYSFAEAVNYLMSLTELQKREYLFAEFFDFWFMINYTWINFLAAKKIALTPRILWIPFVPGVLDFFETILIVYFLHFRQFTSCHELLPLLSSFKWATAIGLIIFLVQKAFGRRANH